MRDRLHPYFFIYRYNNILQTRWGWESNHIIHWYHPFVIQCRPSSAVLDYRNIHRRSTLSTRHLHPLLPVCASWRVCQHSSSSHPHVSIRLTGAWKHLPSVTLHQACTHHANNIVELSLVDGYHSVAEKNSISVPTNGMFSVIGVVAEMWRVTFLRCRSPFVIAIGVATLPLYSFAFWRLSSIQRPFIHLVMFQHSPAEHASRIAPSTSHPPLSPHTPAFRNYTLHISSILHTHSIIPKNQPDPTKRRKVRSAMRMNFQNPTFWTPVGVKF